MIMFVEWKRCAEHKNEENEGWLLYVANMFTALDRQFLFRSNKQF